MQHLRQAPGGPRPRTVVDEQRRPGRGKRAHAPALPGKGGCDGAPTTVACSYSSLGRDRAKVPGGSSAG
jgi:hypothetical protein